MKTLLFVLALVGLSGCAVYPAAPYETYGPSPAYVVTPPLYIHGGIVYENVHPRHHPRAHPRPYPHVYPRGYYRGHPGMRDRDHDGVPNRFDRRPYDPRRR